MASNDSNVYQRLTRSGAALQNVSKNYYANLRHLERDNSRLYDNRVAVGTSVRVGFNKTFRALYHFSTSSLSLSQSILGTSTEIVIRTVRFPPDYPNVREKLLSELNKFKSHHGPIAVDLR